MLLIHVMPWFSAPPTSSEYGWHWTMNRSQEETRLTGKAASHYQPLLGLYDSNDQDVIECHLLWMKAAGFDGILADWYGTQNHFDYPMIHERTKSLFDKAEKFGFKIGVVYEDQTVKNALAASLIKQQDSKKIAEETGRWLKDNWFKKESWLKFKNSPLLLVFGPQHFSESDWSQFRQASGKVDLLTLHHPQPYGQGVFDWPVPSQGIEFQSGFLDRSRGSEFTVSVAFPRFHDYYNEGGEKSYPLLKDADGATLKSTLQTALAQKPNAVQIATWNDWQEGTQVEPSHEVGYRDLAEIQRTRRSLDPSFQFKPSDFDIPLQIFKARKAGIDAMMLNKASSLFLKGKIAESRRLLDQIKQTKAATSLY